MINKLYTGCVESRDDPLKLGRCQVRIVGLHTEDKTMLPTKDLPWAFPVQPINSASISGIGSTPIGPVEGSWVLIVFMDPDQQMPFMMGSLGGVAQIPNATDNPGKIKIQTTDPDGTVNPSPGDPPPKNSTGASTASIKDGKVIQNKDEIIGPLANLIAKGESGSAAYDAFNRGSNAPKGSGSIGGEKLTLVDMTINEIMERQSLPSGSAEKLFAVGKYQCIPITLKAACQALNIDTQQKFTPTTQDIICQEYLVARKRPKLVAYYKNPNKDDEKLLKAAGEALAAEFASIEDPFFIGYPYGGPNGTYAKAGNKVHTKWDQIKPTLIAEWEFRNNPEQPSPTTAIADGDKVEKGSDYSGVEKVVPADDSELTPPESSAGGGDDVPGDLPNPDDLGGLGDLIPAGAGDLTGLADIPGLGNIGDTLKGIDLNNLDLSNISQLGPDLSAAISELGLSGLGNLDASLLSSITSIQNIISNFISSIDPNGDITKYLSPNSLLSEFGGSLNEITDNLGIDNPTGSLAGLAANLGLPMSSLSSGGLFKELEKIAGSDVGQAKALMVKLNNEPTAPQPVPLGEKRPDGTISNGTDVDPNKGFQDPNGVYPKYKNEQDTNRLAYGNNLGRTIVTEKEADRKTGIRIANGGTWDQPPVPYNAVYPYNHVTQYEAGHIIEFDNTPEADRINIHHASGTFTEIDHNGTQVNKIMGDGFEIIERNGFIYIKGGYTVTVDGAFNLRTDNVFNLEVSGAANINIYNNANINVSGDANMAVGGTFNLRANKINMQSEGQFNIKAKGGLNLMADKDMNVYSVGSLLVETEGNISNKTKGSISLQSETDTNIKSGGLLNLESTGKLNLKSGEVASLSGSSVNINSSGSVAIDGSSIQLNDGASSEAGSAGEAKPAKKAGQADIELPIETRGTSGVSQLPPLPLNTRKSEVGFENNDPNNGDLNAYRANRVKNNEMSKSGVSQDTFAKESTKPAGSSSPSGVASDVSAILNMSVDAFNAGMRLSKNFTLGDLTKGGTRIPRMTYQMPTGETLSPQDIVANLKRLCDNVLEPIAEKYGRDSFIITSAFRRPSTGPTDPGDLGIKTANGYQKEGGDHPRGCACDISFKDGKAKTHERAGELTKLVKSWNQIIMEYDNGGSSYWIHCAYKPQGNKGDTFTMVNHKLYIAGDVKHGFVLV